MLPSTLIHIKLLTKHKILQNLFFLFKLYVHNIMKLFSENSYFSL